VEISLKSSSRDLLARKLNNWLYEEYDFIESESFYYLVADFIEENFDPKPEKQPVAALLKAKE
jgi:hypothetical protein